jgi:hypothetical protein
LEGGLRQSRRQRDVQPQNGLNNNEPTADEEAMMAPHSIEWVEAMKYKIVSIYEIKFLNLIDHLKG